MIAFGDSSALVKLYADEKGYESVRAIAGFTVSALARVEVPSALWRKNRIGDLPIDVTAKLVRRFEDDIVHDFAVIPARAAVLEQAARFVATHQMRAYDAVQLASALAARAADPECDHFACFDRSLRAAAVLEGLALIPEELTSSPGG